MIVLRWLPFETADIESFNVYRSIIGFCGKVGVDVTGLTLQLKVNTNTTQTITFTGNDPVADINAQVVGGKAFLNFEQDGFVFRSDIRSAPGFVEIVGGTVLTGDPLELGAPRLIEEKSEDKLIKNVPFDENMEPDEFYEYRDNDGSLLDFYALTAIDSLATESAKTSYAQPIASGKPLCVIEGTLCNIEGARIVDAVITYKIAEYAVAPDQYNSVGVEPLEVRTSHNGRFSFAAIQGVDIQIDIPAIGYSDVVCVPEQSFVYLNEMIATDDSRFKTIITC